MKNVYAMIDIERQFGFKSILYILNGIGGRYGFRNDFSAVKELLKNVLRIGILDCTIITIRCSMTNHLKVKK